MPVLGSNRVEQKRNRFPTVVTLIFNWKWWGCAEGCVVDVFSGVKGRGEPYSSTVGLPAWFVLSSQVA